MLHNSEVPLSALINLASPGEAWDAATTLRKRAFHKENWRVLLQLIVIITVTLATMLAGPLSKVSLKDSVTVQDKELGVLKAIVINDSSTANILNANVLWNETMDSLDQAKYPYNQMLDYIPPADVPWTYTTKQWDPTWRMECDHTPETILSNVTGSGNATFGNPLEAFPSFRNTYKDSWLDRSKYRISQHFCGWGVPSRNPPLVEYLFFVVIQSNPEMEDRMYTNNETLQISISVLHVQNFSATNREDVGQTGAAVWLPDGPVGNATYTRAECNITREPKVSKGSAEAWIWTNDTDSVGISYAHFWTHQVAQFDARNLTIPTPTPETLLRFYQSYMISVNTLSSFPTLQKVSVWMDTVQLSLISLILIAILTGLILWQTSRYARFLIEHTSRLKEVAVPDGKLEWIAYAAKTLNHNVKDEREGKPPEDRDYIRKATFGIFPGDVEVSDAVPRRPSFARVSTNKVSVSKVSVSKVSVSKVSPVSNLSSLSKATTKEPLPSSSEDDIEDGSNLDQNFGSVILSREV